MGTQLRVRDIPWNTGTPQDTRQTQQGLRPPIKHVLLITAEVSDLRRAAAVAQADGLVKQLGHLLVVGVVLAARPRLDEPIVLQLAQRLVREALREHWGMTQLSKLQTCAGRPFAAP